jgi:hypothetical protein
MKTSLYDELRAYFFAAKGTWPTIAKDLGIDKSWISKVLDGRIQDPGVRRTERILKYARAKGWKHKQEAQTRAA